MKIVFTGNMGCGKSTAVAHARQRLPEYMLVDFDKIVLHLYTTEHVQSALLQVFGTSAKTEISKLVHADPSKMALLRMIMDPLIIRHIRQYDNVANVIYDIPLFFEFDNQLNIVPDMIVCIATDSAIQLQRIQTRNPNLTVEEINRILSNQLPQHIKENLATCVVRNNDSIDDLHRQIDQNVIALAMKENSDVQ